MNPEPPMGATGDATGGARAGGHVSKVGEENVGAMASTSCVLHLSWAVLPPPGSWPAWDIA